MKVIIDIPKLNLNDFDKVIMANDTLHKNVKMTKSYKVRTRGVDPQIIAASVGGGSVVLATLIKVISDYINNRRKNDDSDKQIVININVCLNIPPYSNELEIVEMLKNLPENYSQDIIISLNKEI